MQKERSFETEVTYRTSRSSGSGGQHVNKVETRVELLFDVSRSELLDEEEKKLVLERLANRINADGILIVASSEGRSQSRNKTAAYELFVRLIGQALKKRKKRIATKPSAQVNEKRLKQKKQRAETKRLRRKNRFDDE